MPKLSSGRRVGISLAAPRDLLTTGNEAQVLWAIGAFRLKIDGPRELRQLCQVLYFDETAENATKDTTRKLGPSVHDVESGDSGWSATEVEEFVTWMNGDHDLNTWLEQEYKAFDAEIKSHPLWISEFMLGE